MKHLLYSSVASADKNTGISHFESKYKIDWFDRVRYSVDIESQKCEYPEVAWETFAQWAQRQDWSVLEVARVS